MNDNELDKTVYGVLTSRHADVTLKEIVDRIGTPRENAAQALASLASESRAVFLTDGIILSDMAWNRVSETARRMLATFHKKHPFQNYAPVETLQLPLGKAAAVRDFDALLKRLAEQNILVLDETKKKARLPEHEVKMPPGWEKPSREIVAVYQSAGLLPPDPANFQANYPRDISVRTILQILAENGELAALAENLYIHADAVVFAKDIIRRLATQMPQGITPGAVRDATASSRKIILPLLEYLDTIGFTRRTGDVRTLVPQKEPSA